MKVICTDNFNTETRSDSIVCENVTDYYANKIADLLNADAPDDSRNYYIAVSDDHKLFKFEP